MPRSAASYKHDASAVLPAYLVFLTLILAVTTVKAIGHHRKERRQWQAHEDRDYRPQPRAYDRVGRSRRARSRSRRRARDRYEQPVYGYGYERDRAPAYDEVPPAPPPPPQYYERDPPRLIADGHRQEEWDDDSSTLVDGYRGRRY